ncbi:permease prefix domain 1-containing protein [Butyricicoccus sp.]|uniref:permease prefix domain 1-containing protein n=1 Tax=Butyricicoccus sp. TaxID=2049021 RepID=UPI003F144F1F
MNTIRNYINAMFSSLPKTPEILRLQAEMMENMEDKYHDLIREGKSEHEAVGIILADIGSAENLKAELGITDTEPQEDHSAFLTQRAAFQRKFAVAIASGVVLCICAIIAGAVSDTFTHNDAYTCFAFFIPIAAAVAIFVYFGIRESWYENRYKEIYHEAEPESKGFSDAIAAIIFPLAVVIYLILGFVFDLWHPGWIIFPICGLIVAAVEAYEKLKTRQ